MESSTLWGPLAPHFHTLLLETRVNVLKRGFPEVLVLTATSRARLRRGGRKLWEGRGEHPCPRPALPPKCGGLQLAVETKLWGGQKERKMGWFPQDTAI